MNITRLTAPNGQTYYRVEDHPIVKNPWTGKWRVFMMGSTLDDVARDWEEDYCMEGSLEACLDAIGVLMDDLEEDFPTDTQWKGFARRKRRANDGPPL